jgi:hypothetical protein
MALLVCLDCGARYSVGAPDCPQCRSTDAAGDWEEAPEGRQAQLAPGSAGHVPLPGEPPLPPPVPPPAGAP